MSRPRKKSISSLKLTYYVINICLAILAILSLSSSILYYVNEKPNYDNKISKELFADIKTNYNTLKILEEDILPESQKPLSINNSNFAQNIGSELKGVQNIRIIFARPPNIDVSKANNVARILGSPNTDRFQECDDEYCYTYFSLAFGRNFVETEARKYEQNDLNLNLIIDQNVMLIDDLGEVGNVINNPQLGIYDISLFEDDFTKLLEKNSIVTTPNEKIVFFYFDDKGTGEIDESNVFQDKTFRSFANKYRSKAFVNIIETDPIYSYYYTEVFIHEVLHLYGATDKYIEGEINCRANGIGEVDKTPLYPQTKSDIMCGHIIIDEKNPNLNKIGSIIDNEIVINKYTAQEIGW